MTGPMSADRADIDAAARDYAAGWYEGSVERMDRALHADLVKRTLAEGALRAVTKERMLDLTASGGGERPEAEVGVEVHHVFGPIASATVTTPDYVDYLHLVRTPDGWRIANVLFHSRT